MKLVVNPKYGLYEKNGQVFCDTLQIAETFQKRHDNVLRDIENLDCSKEFSLLNFEESNYKIRGKEYPRYLLTKDGFTFLVMRYKGKKAARFKESYITRFNQMESFIKSLQTAKLEFPAFIYKRAFRCSLLFYYFGNFSSVLSNFFATAIKYSCDSDVKFSKILRNSFS